ncbi:MAG: sodium-dependent transporter, partial [Gammaproteobacteria bacterium]
SFIPIFAGRNMFEIVDFTVSNVCLPLNALLIALFAGWAFSRPRLMQEIGLSGPKAIASWAVTVRYLAPVAVGATLVYGLVA